VLREASIGDRSRAAELIARQLAEAARPRAQRHKPARFRVRPDIYRAAELFYEANGLEFGPRPAWIDDRIIRTLIGLHLLERSGRSSGTQYRLLVHPADLAHLAELRGVVADRQAAETQLPPALSIDEGDREYIRAHVRAYLALCGSLESATVSRETVRAIETRASEILASSFGSTSGPHVTPLQARAIARQEAGIELDARLRREFRPIMFELFGGVGATH
jgi:hypothetical protein